ncbi:GntR family transcriptional regulator [Mycolicibacterium sp. P9-64]|nr:GntR family transcriptional regulator [Mycolicibacterium sp. P9-64]
MIRPTRVDDAYNRLRAAILHGRHRPGSRLLLTALCVEYEISSGVLREVLPRLLGEGLVVAEPQRGFRVVEVSAEDLRALTESRVLVEAAALRQAINCGDLQWESALVAAHHTLTGQSLRAEDGSLRREWFVAHSDFHRALLAGSPNHRLQEIADRLRDATEIYRYWSESIGDDHDRDIAGEHASILEATLARDAERAVALLTSHYERTRDILLRVQNEAGIAEQAG